MSWKNYKSTFVSVAGILGLVLGGVLISESKLLYYKGSIFHEIEYLPKTLIAPLISWHIVDYQTRISNANKNLKHLTDTNTKSVNDEAIKAQKYYRDSLVKISDRYLSYERKYGNTSLNDSTSFQEINNVLHFDVTPGKIMKWDSVYYNGNLKSFYCLDFYVKDFQLPWNDKLVGKHTFRIVNSKSDLDFIAKYPVSGFWILCTMCLISFCAMAIVNSFDVNNKIDQLTDKAKDNKKFWIVFVISLIVLLGLWQLWEHIYFNKNPILGIFFMKSYAPLNQNASVIICLTGAFFFTGIVKCSAVLSVLILDKNNLEPKSTGSFQEQLKHNPMEQIVLLNGYFNAYFLMISIVLSLIVLSTGTLYSTVNSLDFIKLLSDDWGYSPARYEFVYLYGLLYTSVMLIVYLPAKLQFNAALALLPDNESSKTALASSGLKDPIATIKSIIIILFPLLAGVLNSVFDLLFKN